jgi:16S rRNA (adenine1518-N6/adenine1519-N6)-dimethyltransferase
MKLSEMKQLLAEHQLQLTKSLGQNFLHDANQLHRIVAAAQLHRDDKVLEIGPGLGPLTELLLREAGHVLAIEKDQRLVQLLRPRLESSALEILHADALEYLREHRNWSGWKVVSNLPYSVASPILVELAHAEQSPDLIVATLQLEVVQRIAAHAGDDDYGLLSLLLQLRFEPVGTFKVPRTCFFPEPDVDSACITLRKREQPLLAPDVEQACIKIVRQAFSQRRKMMLKLLKQHWDAPRLETSFAKIGLPANIRAEAVTLEQFVELTRALTAK